MKAYHHFAMMFCALLAACSAAESQAPQNMPETDILSPVAAAVTEPAENPRLPYAEFLETVTASKRLLDASPRALLYRYINTDMPAYWNETTWDFNGVSRVPGEGEIACGYFVTTLLQDLGFPLARVRLAQEPSSVMITELTTNVKKFSTREAMLDWVKTQPEPGVYIIGLDFHTGFITAGGGEVNFVHSNYIDREGVMTEPAATSNALSQSGFFMIGSLTANQEMMMIWRAQ